ncbi:unnamed protein product [Fraxinus pennsylvanica]|uniref:Glycosyltransferases n=1 Tax=Fraxinus pennsylvanica TaxID=56036 RepID=A0AAD1ZKW5_9LAMI|nr:unnamed protein product [Fraxinus pennsylvanica]
MASIRRTLSPVPRSGSLMNGEACQVASPLSKSSSNSLNPPPHSSVLASSVGSLDYALYKVQNFILGLLSQRSSRSSDRLRVKGQVWRRVLFHFFICFVVGVFVGFTPFVSLNLSMNIVSKHQDFYFEVVQPVPNSQFHGRKRNEKSVLGRLSVNENATLDPRGMNSEPKDDFVSNRSSSSVNQGSDPVFHELVIIVTPTHARPLQAYYLNRLAHTLKLVPHPFLWIVVEMNSQSVETADLLRKTGVMYRHLFCSKNSTDMKDRRVHLRNVALSHIETHHLEGIVYFADDDNIYSADLFHQMRQIRRFGTWTVAKLMESRNDIILEGPICNGSQVIGWHIDDITNRFRRFHAEMSGFAFNSTVIWDPKRWHRPTLERIRQLDAVREGFQASAFIEQIVEDESQMECLPHESSEIMVWHHSMDSHSYTALKSLVRK